MAMTTTTAPATTTPTPMFLTVDPAIRGRIPDLAAANGFELVEVPAGPGQTPRHLLRPIARRRREGAPSSSLTERELQVLNGMAMGRSNGEIGRSLYLSEDTVKTHARRLFRKLGARDRAHAVHIGHLQRLLWNPS